LGYSRSNWITKVCSILLIVKIFIFVCKYDFSNSASTVPRPRAGWLKWRHNIYSFTLRIKTFIRNFCCSVSYTARSVCMCTLALK
jgi:hypothetical protein